MNNNAPVAKFLVIDVDDALFGASDCDGVVTTLSWVDMLVVDERGEKISAASIPLRSGSVDLVVEQVLDGYFGEYGVTVLARSRSILWSKLHRVAPLLASWLENVFVVPVDAMLDSLPITSAVFATSASNRRFPLADVHAVLNAYCYITEYMGTFPMDKLPDPHELQLDRPHKRELAEARARFSEEGFSSREYAI